MLAHVAAYSAYATPGRMNQFTFAARQCVAKLIFKIRKSAPGWRSSDEGACSATRSAWGACPPPTAVLTIR